MTMVEPEIPAEEVDAPVAASPVMLSVENAVGVLTIPVCNADGDPEAIAAAVGAVAEGRAEFPVQVDVEAGGATVTGEALTQLRDDLVSALDAAGISAGYDGDGGSVNAPVPEGVDDAFDGEAVANALIAPDGTTFEFTGTGSSDSDSEDAAPEQVEETFGVGVEEGEDTPLVTVSEDGAWEGVLIVEGVPSGDNRMIEAEALTWRELPISLMAMFRNPEGGKGHDAAAIAGSIETIERRDDGRIWGTGHLDMEGDVGKEAYRLMDKGLMRGVSADLDRVEVSWENEMGDSAGLEEMLGFDPGTMLITSGRIMGATLCPFPAFEEAYVNLVDATDPVEEALVAAGGVPCEARVWTPWGPESLVASGALVSEIPVAPPSDWFSRPTADELTGLRSDGRAWRIADDGRVYGFAAVNDVLHLGGPRVANRGKVPKSPTNYAYFRTGEVHCADGTIVATGPVCMDTVHPDLKQAASDAQSWYHHTGAVACDIAVWDDEEAGGIVFAGALRPGVTPSQVRMLRASDGVSPDWRRLGGRLDCVAMLVVNNSGFKVPALVASGGDDLAAAGNYVMPGTFAARYLVAGEEPLAMVAAGGFAARRPARDSAIVSLASQVAHLRSELRELSTVVRPMRQARAQALLQRMTSDR